MVMTLKAESRKETMKSEIKQLRRKGKVPGVVYGKKIGSTAITIEEKELQALLRKNPHAIIEMELPDGGKYPVMMNELQRDKIHRNLLHVDFHQINMDEKVKTVVTLEFVGESVGVSEGGIVQIQHHELEIRCLPQNIPSSIQIDISGLGLGDNLLVSDLSLSSEIEVKSDPGELIITVLAPQKEIEEVEPTGDAESAAEAKAKTEAAKEAEKV